jgi:MoaA/NifB/PqqE/SkfB family radical SAM enzyme
MGLGTFSEEKRSSILKRNYSNKKVEELIRNFGKTKMYLIMDFIMGLPGQDRSEVLSMGNFFNKNRPDVLSGLFLRYYPKTEITNLAVTSGLINIIQLNLLDNCGFKERIIIEGNLYKWLKKVQCLILFSRYLPKEIVKLFYKIEIFKFFPAIDWNNLFVILDSTLPKLNCKTRIHTDAISLFQHLHFYAYHVGDLIVIDFLLLYKRLKASVKNSIKKWQLIYRLGIKGVKPLKLIMAMRYLFKTIILREDCPGAVIIGLTKKCQCKCVHCSVAYDSAISKVEMDVKKIKSLMNQVAALGIPKINLFGGEPLAIGEEIVGLVDHASKRGLSVSIDTNGILLTETLTKKLKQAGIDNINISLDSADRKIHDSLRGFNGAYDNATRAIDSCVRFGINCIISTYASRRAIQSGDLVRIIDLARGSKATAVKILFPLMSGRWSHNGSELLSNKERFIVYGLLDPGFVYLESPLFSIRNGRKICEALDKKMLYVSPVGDMQACYAIPVTFGNVNDEPLKKIMLRMWDSKLFTEVDNNHECVMNSADFRENYFSKKDNSKEFPIYYQDFFK